MTYMRCDFTIGERRCRVPATMSHSIKVGEDTKWYCLDHYRKKEGGPEGLAFMELVERDWNKRWSEWKADPRHWNDKLIDKWIHEHPGVVKQPGDDKYSYLYKLRKMMPRSPQTDEALKAIVQAAEREYGEREVE